MDKPGGQDESLLRPDVCTAQASPASSVRDRELACALFPIRPLNGPSKRVALDGGAHEWSRHPSISADASGRSAVPWFQGVLARVGHGGLQSRPLPPQRRIGVGRPVPSKKGAFAPFQGLQPAPLSREVPTPKAIAMLTFLPIASGCIIL